MKLAFTFFFHCCLRLQHFTQMVYMSVYCNLMNRQMHSVNIASQSCQLTWLLTETLHRRYEFSLYHILFSFLVTNIFNILVFLWHFYYNNINGNKNATLHNDKTCKLSTIYTHYSHMICCKIYNEILPEKLGGDLYPGHKIKFFQPPKF